MNRIIEYKIVKGGNLDKLEDNTNFMVDKGWEPYGEISEYYEEHIEHTPWYRCDKESLEPVYIQSMVLRNYQEGDEIET